MSDFDITQAKSLLGLAAVAARESEVWGRGRGWGCFLMKGGVDLSDGSDFRWRHVFDGIYNRHERLHRGHLVFSYLSLSLLTLRGIYGVGFLIGFLMSALAFISYLSASIKLLMQEPHQRETSHYHPSLNHHTRTLLPHLQNHQAVVSQITGDLYQHYPASDQ